ncbi:MAG: hypothetical protein JNK45_23630 [Myxococcales bacterium]|nr:hypothetical protein [Myxococcales bacterium]
MARRRVLVCCVGLVLGSLAGATTVAAAPPAVREYDGPAEVGADPDAVAIEPAAVAEPEPEPEPEPELAHEVDPEPAARPSVDEMIAPEVEPVEKAWMPRHRLIYRNLVAGRINPRGAVNDLTLGYRLQILRRTPPLFRDSYAMLGAHAFVTPAFVRVGPTVEFQPVAVLNVGATYDVVGAFGNFKQVQSFATPTDRWGPDDLKRNGEAGDNYRTWGHLVTLSAMLQFKYKRVALRTATRGHWSRMRLRDGDRVYYDAALDLLVPNDGWSIINETDLLYMFDRGLRLVVRHSVSHAFYRRRDFLPAEPVSQPNGPTSRLGPAVTYTFFDRPGARFNRPTVFLLSQWWLRHRFRTGEQSSAGIPYLAVGFSFEGDIVPHRKVERRRGGRRRGTDLETPAPPGPVP